MISVGDFKIFSTNKIKSDSVLRQNITDFPYDFFFPLVSEYLVRSFGKDENPKEIIDDIYISSVDDSKSFWVFYDNAEAIGFGFADIRYSEKGHKTCVINHLFINGKNNKLIHEFDYKVEKWAKKRGCEEMGFFTRRNPVAFLKKLKNGWEFDCYVLTRKI